MTFKFEVKFEVDFFVGICEQSDVFQTLFNFLLQLLFCVCKYLKEKLCKAASTEKYIRPVSTETMTRVRIFPI